MSFIIQQQNLQQSCSPGHSRGIFAFLCITFWHWLYLRWKAICNAGHVGSYLECPLPIHCRFYCHAKNIICNLIDALINLIKAARVVLVLLISALTLLFPECYRVSSEFSHLMAAPPGVAKWFTSHFQGWLTTYLGRGSNILITPPPSSSRYINDNDIYY